MSLHSTIASVRTRRMLTWFVPVVGLALYLILVPPVPDFAAQATRAAVFRQLGLGHLVARAGTAASSSRRTP